MPLLGPYIQKFIESTPELVIPLWQVLLYVLAISLAALFERYRFILVLSYVFMVHWVFIENGRRFSLNYVSVITGFVFLVFGLMAMLLTIYNMLTRDK
jgi:hypothetical protein